MLPVCVPALFPHSCPCHHLLSVGYPMGGRESYRTSSLHDSFKKTTCFKLWRNDLWPRGTFDSRENAHHESSTFDSFEHLICKNWMVSLSIMINFPLQCPTSRNVHCQFTPSNDKTLHKWSAPWSVPYNPLQVLRRFMIDVQRLLSRHRWGRDSNRLRSLKGSGLKKKKKNNLQTCHCCFCYDLAVKKEEENSPIVKFHPRRMPVLRPNLMLMQPCYLTSAQSQELMADSISWGR